MKEGSPQKQSIESTKELPQSPNLRSRLRLLSTIAPHIAIIFLGVAAAACNARGETTSFTPQSVLENESNPNIVAIHISGKDYDGDGRLTLFDAIQDHPPGWNGRYAVQGNIEIDEPDIILVESHIGSKNPVDLSRFDVDSDDDIDANDVKMVENHSGETVSRDNDANVLFDWVVSGGIRTDSFLARFSRNVDEEEIQKQIEKLGYPEPFIHRVEPVPGSNIPVPEAVNVFITVPKGVNLLNAMTEMANNDNVIGVDWNIAAALSIGNTFEK